MGEPSPRFDLASVVTLAEVRGLLRRSSFRGAAALFGTLYVLGSLFESGMVVLGSFPGGYSSELLLASPTGVGWWNYPGLLVVAPWGVVSLPFFPTVAMLIVGVGVGFGMAVALVLVVRLLRPSPGVAQRTKAVGAVSGLTPAMISLVTLGACCSTTAVATAGVGLVADASATTVSNLLLNNWFLGVFQIVVVWIALLGQELLLTIYRGLFDPSPITARVPSLPAMSARRWVAGGAARAVLLVGGVLWSLGTLVAWTTTDPTQAGPGFWFSWIVQHELVGVTAIALAFFPAGTLLEIRRLAGSSWGRVVPGALLVGAASLLVWLPYPLESWGLDSLLDRLIALAGGGPRAGGIPGVSGLGAGVGFVYLVEYLVPAAAGVIAVLRPGALERALGVDDRRARSPDSVGSSPRVAPSPGGSDAGPIGVAGSGRPRPEAERS